MDEFWMQKAVLEGRRAADMGEVPVGSAIVSIEGRTARRSLQRNDPSQRPDGARGDHSLKNGGVRDRQLPPVGTTVYSTIEPCAMCAGALVNARVRRLVFGTR